MPLVPAMGVQGKQISLMLRSSQSANKSMSQTNGKKVCTLFGAAFTKNVLCWIVPWQLDTD